MIKRRYEQALNMNEMREYYEQFMDNVPCHVCQGKRLKKESLAVTVGGLNISELTELSIGKALDFFKNLQFLRDKAFARGQGLLTDILGRNLLLKGI